MTQSQTEGKKEQRQIIFRAWDKKLKKFHLAHDIVIRGDGTNILEDQIILNQWTGLNDFEGKAIYEGDIVVNWVKNGTRSKTRWSNKRIIEFKDGSFGIRKGKCYQIVGNIYEKQT